MIDGAMSGPFYNLRLHVCFNHSAAERAAAVPSSPTPNDNSILFPRRANEDSKAQFIRVTSDLKKWQHVQQFQQLHVWRSSNLTRNPLMNPWVPPLPPWALII